jgi:cytidyltransferase-like protein
MNLGEYLANIILEAGNQSDQTIALFPGAFKPPHKGHVDVVEKLLQAADQVVVLVSPQTREGVTADESIAVWNLYKDKFNGSVEVKVSADSSPVKEVYNVVKDNPDTNFIVAFGKGEMDRYKSIEKYPNVKVFDAGAIEGVSATNLRMALIQKNEEEIAKYLPDGVSVDEFLQALNTKPEEKPEEVPTEQIPTETPSTETTPPEGEQPLQESPPINFEDDPYQDYVLANRPKIEKAAAVFNIPIDDMEYAFNGGTEVVLNDDMWSEMENTKSYNMKTLDDAIAHSLKLGINPKPYIDAIKKKEDMPLPLVLQWQQGKYYLVGGEVVLSLYRSLGVIPTVLQGTLNLQTKQLHQPLEEGLDTSNDKKLLKKFITFAIKELGIQKPPTSLTLSRDNNAAKSMHTFGSFDPNNDKIWLYVKNRNMADLLRTLAHELVHRKQAEEGRLEPDSGKTGSDIENEANAQAGVLLRKFGKQNEEIYQ